MSRFTELSQAVQPLLDAVVTEDAARHIEHQRYYLSKTKFLRRSTTYILYT